jgi:nucleotide-binding universal stress UspA family protein
MDRAKLLLAFDGSPAALRAVELVAGYAGERDALAVILLNVQKRPISLWPAPSTAVGAMEAALMEEGAAALEPALARLAAAGVPAQAEVRLGIPAQAILQEAKASGAQAMVMGTRGAGPLHGYALGSVALRVAHGGGAPVILVKPHDRLPAALGRRLRVMLAMDGSEPALRAARQLADWRGWLGELEVHLVHVQAPLTTLQAVLPPHDDLVAQWSAREGEQATQAARELLRAAGITQHLHLSAGDPALELRTLAAQGAVDLLALGTRGLGAAHHALVGSVALKAAAAVDIPVLLAA